MFTNVSNWDVLTAAKDVGKIHDSDPPMTGLVEGLSGSAVAIVFLIGIAIAVRKYLETVQGVLEQLLSVLTAVANAIQKRVTSANPPPLQMSPANETTQITRYQR